MKQFEFHLHCGIWTKIYVPTQSQ